MPTQMDFLRAKVLAYKTTLDGKPSREKEDRVSRQVAEQFNSFLEEIKKESSDVTPHLPQPITWKSMPARDFQLSDVQFLDLEMMLNQVLAVLDEVRGKA